MPLKQALVRRSDEWKPREKVLVIRFHALGQSGARITGDNEADQDRIHVHLVTVGRRAAAEAPAIGEL